MKKHIIEIVVGGMLAIGAIRGIQSSVSSDLGPPPSIIEVRPELPAPEETPLMYYPRSQGK